MRYTVIETQKLIKKKCFLKLTYIEAPSQQFYGWIGATSKYNVRSVSLPENMRGSKSKTMIFAAIDKKQEKQMKLFKDFMINTLGCNIDVKPFKSESKVIAKSTKSEKVSIREDEWTDFDNLDKLNRDGKDIVAKMAQIQHELKEQENRHIYREKHLKKWAEDIKEREESVEFRDKDMVRRENEISSQRQYIDQKENELTKMDKILQSNKIKNENETKQIYEKKQSLNVKEQTLNEQQTKQSQLQKELDSNQQKLSEQQIALDNDFSNLSKREQAMKEREDSLNEKSEKLEQEKEKFLRDEQNLKDQASFIENKRIKMNEEQKQLKIDKSALDKDRTKWTAKRSTFQQREDALVVKGNELDQRKSDMDKESVQLAADQNAVSEQEKANKNLSNELYSKENELKLRAYALEQRQNKYESDQSVFKQELETFNKQKTELKSNQNTYNIQIKQLNEERIKFDKDFEKLQSDQKVFNEAQSAYDRDKAQFDKDRKSLDLKIETMEKEKVKNDELSKKLELQQNKLNETSKQLKADRNVLDKEREVLNEQKLKLKEAKNALHEKRIEIDQKFVELNNKRNTLSNDQIAAKQKENELNTKEKNLERKMRANEQKEQEIMKKYDRLKSEEKEVLAKIDPIKQREKLLNEQQSALSQKETKYAQMEKELNAQQKKNNENQTKLAKESEDLRKERAELNVWNESLQAKNDKLAETDRRIIRMYDEFNIEKYEVTKLDNLLDQKQAEINEKEVALNKKEENLTKMQRQIEEEKEKMIKDKNDLKTEQNEFIRQQNELKTAQIEYATKYDQFVQNQRNLDENVKDVAKQRDELKQQRQSLEFDKNAMDKQLDYIKQQNQALSVQKKTLDEEKSKIDSNALLLASRTQQIQSQSETQNATRFKLEKIKNDLQIAQKNHETEDQKLRIWQKDLEKEQQRLREEKEILLVRIKSLDATALKLSQQELEQEKVANALQKQKIELDAMKETFVPMTKVHELEKKEIILNEREKMIKIEQDSHKEKEEIFALSKQQIISKQSEFENKQKELMQKENELNVSLKNMEQTKHGLEVETIKKETELKEKESALRQRDIAIYHNEKRINEKENELKRTEDRLEEMKKELKAVQTDLDLQKSANEIKLKKDLERIEFERENVQNEKTQIMAKQKEIENDKLQQIKVQSDYEQELKLHVNDLKVKCEQLSNELDEMRQSVSQKDASMNKMESDNMNLMKEKDELKAMIANNEKMEKQQKRPIDLQRFALKQNEMALLKQTENIKHKQSGLKREDNKIKSRENKVIREEERLKEKEKKQQQQQYDLDKLTQNVQMEILRTQKAQQSAKEAEQLQIEKMKLVTGLQQSLQRAQEATVHKDMLINELQQKYSEINRTFMKQHGLLIHVEHVQKESAKKDEMIQKLNKEIEELKAAKSENMIIKEVEKTTTTTATSAAQKVEKIEPKISVSSVPLSEAGPISVVSRMNQPKIGYISPSSIDVNDPLITSENVISAAHVQEIKSAGVESVPFSVAERTSLLSKHNRPKEEFYVQPKSINTNIAKSPSFNLLSTPQQRILNVADEADDLLPDKKLKQKEQEKKEKVKEEQPPKQQTKAKEPQPKEQVTEERKTYKYPPKKSPTKPYKKPEGRTIEAEISDFIKTFEPDTNLATTDTTPTTTTSVPFTKAEPTSMISKRNEPKIDDVMAKSVPINDPEMTSQSVIDSPTESTKIESVLDAEIATANVESVPFMKASETSVISRMNQPKIGYIKPSSIGINDPLATSKDVVSAAQKVEQIEPKIPYSSVDIFVAEPMSKISRTNRPKIPGTVTPESITINDPLAMMKDTVSVPERYQTPETMAIPAVPFMPASSTSALSRFNQPRLSDTNIASSIPITSIIEATDSILSHPVDVKTSGLDMDKMDAFAKGIADLRQKTEEQGDKKEEDVAVEMEDKLPIIEEFEETEQEFDSGLTSVDLDKLFQCSTNSDLLFDDVSHLETIYLGLSEDVRNCLSDCREYKSLINPLPSTFCKNFLDLSEDGDENIFDGDVIICLQWKFDNAQISTLCDDINTYLVECDRSIDHNRSLMEEYKIALDDDNKKSVSNRNKLRAKNRFNGSEKMHILDINKNGTHFKNDLDSELLELQYTNSEILTLRSTLEEWKTCLLKACDNDNAAIQSSDELYLRSFCILPSQLQSVRESICKHSDHLHHEMLNRKWVKTLNNLLKNNNDGNNFEIFYSAMGPDVASWEDKLLCRDLTSYLLNGTNFELHSMQSSALPLSEGFVRIGYEAQILIESAQTLLAHIDPFIEEIVEKAQDWSNRDEHAFGGNLKNLENSLQNGKDLAPLDSFSDKTPLQRTKLLQNDEKYMALFKDPLIASLDELMSDMNNQTMDAKYIKKLHKFLVSYFQNLYRDKLMLPTPNSAIIEETAYSETWQKHALLEAVFSDEFGKILELLSNESLTKKIAHFLAYDVYEQKRSQNDEQKKKEKQIWKDLFEPFSTFYSFHQTNIKQKMYKIVNDFDIQQFLSDNIYQNALKRKLTKNRQKKHKNDQNKWAQMTYSEKMLKPQQFSRNDELQKIEGSDMPSFSSEEALATYWTGYLKGVLNEVPVERPIRLSEHYHDLDAMNANEHDSGYLTHLKQHYYIDTYKPPSNEDVAQRISHEDKMNGVDIYRDRYIQRPHQSQRILQTQLKFLYHNKMDYMRGAFPMNNFNCLPYGTKKPIKHRVTVRKSPFVHARAQENYEMRIYTKVATNFKLTSNRTADMFNARGFDIVYDSVRVM